MKEVPINAEYDLLGYAKVDDEDFEEVSKFSWRLDTAGYPRANINYKGKRYYISLHHLVFFKKPGFVIDHIDRDLFNCQKSNLRHVTTKQNAYNKKIHCNNSLGVKGVTRTREGRYYASVMFDSKRIYMGPYSAVNVADEAYRDMASLVYGEYVRFV